MYTYQNLLDDMRNLASCGVANGIMGKTALGTEIPYLFLGDFRRGKNIIVQGAIHAREHITANLIVKMVYDYINRDAPIAGGIFFVPMVNIDGVRLTQEGADFIANGRARQFVLAVNGANGNDFTYWKANINAVDLNTNFDARWGTGAENVRAPAPANYIGPFPESEPETRALTRFTRAIRPAATLSYHIRGEEIYWEFFQTPSFAVRDRRIGQSLSAETGYTLIDEIASAGGYKDWCIQNFRIPAYTIECGDTRYSYPFPYSQLPVIFEQNKNVPLLLLNRV